MEMVNSIDEAEKEASEVLHTLLAVERIEKHPVIINVDTLKTDNGHDKKANGGGGSKTGIKSSSTTISSNNNTSSIRVGIVNTNLQNNENIIIVDDGDSSSNSKNNQLRWTTSSTPVTITSQSIYTPIDESQFQQYQIDEQDQLKVLWDGNTLTAPNHNNNQTEHSAFNDNDHPSSASSASSTIQIIEVSKSSSSSQGSNNGKRRLHKVHHGKKSKSNKKRKPPQSGPTKLEESAAQVKDRFKRGCECQDESCFRGLNADNVYKHRLNIAELTKSEHDMYLMGVTMACLANPDTTVRHKERRRLRAQYVYQGRRVCLDAFLYLENCTHYQLKRIRKHVMTHGVAPRVHGNHGKKPHNTFPLDIYYHATEFLKQYLEQYTSERDDVVNKQPVQLPWDVTRKNLHDAYKDYGKILDPNAKLMGYSTFRHFMKEQFPHVRFCKLDMKNPTQTITIQQATIPQIINCNSSTNNSTTSGGVIDTLPKCIINSGNGGTEVRQVAIPLVVAQSNNNSGASGGGGGGSNHHHHPQAFLVTPVSQLISSNTTATAVQSGSSTSNSTFSYQLTNTGGGAYVINEQCNIVTAMSSTPHTTHTPSSYTFNRI